MRRDQEIAVRMWLEYALDGEETAMAATGYSVNGCMAVALDLLDDAEAGWAAHAKHRASVVIDDVRRR